MYSGKKEIEMKDLKNKNLVLAAIAREMNFWYDVSLKTDSNITKENYRASRSLFRHKRK